MGILDHLNCLLRNMYAGGQEAIEQDMELFQIGKGIH